MLLTGTLHARAQLHQNISPIYNCEIIKKLVKDGMLPAFPFLLPAYTPKNSHRHHGILFSPYLKQEVVWPKTLIFWLRFESVRTNAKRERRRKLHSGVSKTLAVNSFRFDVDELGKNRGSKGKTSLGFYFLCVVSQYTDYTQSFLSLTFFFVHICLFQISTTDKTQSFQP